MNELPKKSPEFLIAQFRHQTEQLLAKRATLEAVPLPNPTDVGGYLERLVREFLENHLPGKCGVTSGYVVNSHAEVSRQQDVIIYDKLEGANYSGTNEYSVLPIESVYATIEIKATLSKKTLDDALVNSASVKNLHGTMLLVERETGEIEDVKGYGEPIYTALVAFGTGVKLETCGDNLEQSSGSLDHICILGSGNVVWCAKEKQVDGSLYSMHIGPRVSGECDHIAILEPSGAPYTGFPLYFFLQEVRDFVTKQAARGRHYSLHEYIKWPTEGMSIKWK